MIQVQGAVSSVRGATILACVGSLRQTGASRRRTWRVRLAEKTMLVCDTCGKPAVESVKFSLNGKNLVKDFCAQHLAELVKGARAPKRGRRPGTTVRKTTAKKTAAKKGPGRPRKATGATRKPAAAKRRGRPKKRVVA